MVNCQYKDKCIWVDTWKCLSCKHNQDKKDYYEPEKTDYWMPYNPAPAYPDYTPYPSEPYPTITVCWDTTTETPQNTNDDWDVGKDDDGGKIYHATMKKMSKEEKIKKITVEKFLRRKKK